MNKAEENNMEKNKIEELKRKAYFMARTDIDADHPDGIGCLDEVFSEISMMLATQEKMDMSENVREKIKNILNWISLSDKDNGITRDEAIEQLTALIQEERKKAVEGYQRKLQLNYGKHFGGIETLRFHHLQQDVIKEYLNGK